MWSFSFLRCFYWLLHDMHLKQHSLILDHSQAWLFPFNIHIYKYIYILILIYTLIHIHTMTGDRTRLWMGWGFSNSWSSSMMCISPAISTARCSQPWSSRQTDNTLSLELTKMGTSQQVHRIIHRWWQLTLVSCQCSSWAISAPISYTVHNSIRYSHLI